MEDNKVDRIQQLKELEIEIQELRVDAFATEKKIPGRIERINDLEREAAIAKGQLTFLYANLRTLNNKIQDKMGQMNEIMKINTTNYIRTTLKEEK